MIIQIFYEDCINHLAVSNNYLHNSFTFIWLTKIYLKLWILNKIKGFIQNFLTSLPIHWNFANLKFFMILLLCILTSLWMLRATESWSKYFFCHFRTFFLLLNQLSFCCTFTTDNIWDGFQYNKQPFLPNKVGKKEQDRQQVHDIAKYFTLMVLCLVI